MPPSFETAKLDAIEDRLDEMERRKGHGSSASYRTTHQVRFPIVSPRV
jgi:hypothetical protein